MRNPVEKAERIYFRFFALTAAGFVLLVVLVWAGVGAYHRWQEGHLVRRAAAYLSGGDYKTAALSARRAYQLNSESADAARVLADIAERASDGTELGWRRRVVELRPDSTEDALALIRCALRANDFTTAEKALDKLRPLAEQTPGYHAALGRMAEMRSKPAEAEQHWAKAVELAPSDTAYQVQLALVQLGLPDEAKRAGARETLHRLRADPRQRAATTRALIMDGANRREDPQRLRALAEQLQSYPDAAFPDGLLFLEILRQMRDPKYDEYLKTLENDARASSPNAAGLISSLTTVGNAAEAIRFSGTLPPEASKWPVPLATAEAYARAEDWAGLHRAIDSSAWGGFEFLRHAYLTRALRAEQRQLEADQQWSKAQKEAAMHPQAMLLLARTVSGWGWQNDTVELLWTLSKAEETRKEALQLLYKHYAQSGDTNGVYRVLLHTAEIAPDDLMVQNNLAQVSLLLDKNADRARKIAAELARKDPFNAAYISTYAFSLYASGDVEEAKDEFEKLREDQLQVPSIAAYYGVVLAASGEKARAREYLERGKQAFLLPEEKALVAKAESATQ